MRFRCLPPLFAAIAVLALAGCEQGASGARDPRIGTRADAQSTATMEFRGRRPCVDCLGIDAWLRLEQDGEVRRYALVERYRLAGGERRFEERGDWRNDGDLLRLRADDGGHRTYAQMPGHGLQARASDGGPLAAAADDVMMPTTFDNTR